MRFIASTLCLLLASSVLAAARSDNNPKNVRVWVQFIALPHQTLIELLAQEPKSDDALHNKLMALSKTGGAEIVETGMISGHNDEMATVESIREEIYPTEYDPPEIAMGAEPDPLPLESLPMEWPRAINCTAFETRDTGLMIEVKSTIRPNDHVDVRITSEVVHNLRHVTWFELKDAWGTIRATFPIYETWRGNQSVTLKSGTFGLLFACTPKRQLTTRFENTRILAFARADILSVEP